ncbi:HDOD domain-containing protein [Desulfovibrio psychrotolerans]|uniref:Phosphohydrolase n=1 Tax=Desulfovibrio psychrotolerans TaxID=415242 RepID=A0A7J0BSY5_9BACT|nr:HDOD domain-containing protein [Desulfovibrio psychrotolerans]GFM36282.1 phosphohydrolase [Desulfovibrio psychrotolerans]
MARINAPDLRPGMVLAQDATGANGRLLLPKGTTLEERHIRVLHIWGAIDADIENLSREDSQQAALQEMQHDHVEAATRYVDILFRHADLSVPPMHELYTQCRRHYAELIAAGGRISEETFGWNPLPMPDTFPPMDLESFVSSDKGLASFPDIYFRISDALNDPNSTASRLAEVISKDPSMSAKLLQLVNSPFYGFGQRIDSLSRGVVLVGARELSQLALGVAVMDLFIGVPDGLITVRGFWQHSIACGVLCRIIASHIPGMQQERCFVIGLLHDVGRLVMLKLAPREIAWAINLSRTENMPLYQAEKAVFGFDHTDVTEALFTRWNLPGELLEGVAEHHATHRPTFREAAICGLGDTMAIAMGHGFSGTMHVRTLPPEMWRALEVPDSILNASMLAARRQIDDILTIFMK